jgi:cysteinyl-tRNA synthetase
MRIYNTLSGQIEAIQPLEPGTIRMYSCGPTVYRFIHIGNLRTFTMADWLRRVFEYRGLRVTHVKNITDVGHMRQERLDQGEDKLLAQARKEGKSAASIAEFYTDAFMEDERQLNILPAHYFPRATQHIPEMIEIVRGLEAKGLAYEAGGNVFFDVRRFPGYGKLSGNKLEQLIEGVSDVAGMGKRHPADFPLWKVAEPGREMAWESPWGWGFPGWHIECSAMSMKYLGRHFDIHTGGVDNIFPHHEDEIAQSEGYTGGPFVNYWIHAQHLLADGLKMAKSTGNAYTRADIEARGFEPLALRYFYTTALYRSRINFTFTALEAAQTALNRLRAIATDLAAVADLDRLPPVDANSQAASWRERFLAEVEDDLNMPQAMAVLWEFLRSDGINGEPAAKLALLLDVDRILGFGLADYLRSDQPRLRREPAYALRQAPLEVAQLVVLRAEARAAGDFARADALRQELAEAGYSVRDTDHGPLVAPVRAADEFATITGSTDVPDERNEPDCYEFSVSLLAANSREDLERCVRSIARHSNGRSIELVILDNGSTDSTTDYVRHLIRQGVKDEQTGKSLGLRALFADHNLGFAAGRNATFRASRGHFIVMLDTSIELTGDIWTPLAATLADASVGVAGPYGLVTDDLREFREADGREVDAIEGYLMAFRRALLTEVGWADEKFRFYRLMDIWYSFHFKTSGYRVVVTPEVAARLEKHPHREWYSLSEEEQATKSKKNYDLFRRRWHHGESLLVANYDPSHHWPGHDHGQHVGGERSHTPDELPPPGEPHTHEHRHWPDHSHTHPHCHDVAGS